MYTFWGYRINNFRFDVFLDVGDRTIEAIEINRFYRYIFLYLKHQSPKQPKKQKLQFSHSDPKHTNDAANNI